MTDPAKSYMVVTFPQPNDVPRMTIFDRAERVLNLIHYEMEPEQIDMVDVEQLARAVLAMRPAVPQAIAICDAVYFVWENDCRVSSELATRARETKAALARMEETREC